MEVRPTGDTMGMFATKDFKLGDIVVEETTPLATLCVPTEASTVRQRVFDLLRKPPGEKVTSAWESSLTVPSSIPLENYGKFNKN